MKTYWSTKSVVWFGPRSPSVSEGAVCEGGEGANFEGIGGRIPELCAHLINLKSIALTGYCQPADHTHGEA